MPDDSSPVDASILQTAGAAMPALVSPRRSASIADRMPDLQRIVDAAAAPGPMRQCLYAGLWLLADDLDGSHKICQDVPTSYGSAWHAIVHRREGDFWNSKYWWRRARGIKWAGFAGRLQKALTTTPGGATAVVLRCLSGDTYDPSVIVDLVEANATRPVLEITEALVIVQRLEWMSLFEECWKD